MSEELKAIRERHFKRQAAMSVIGTDDSELLEAHADRATLLSALTAANARAEAAEAKLAEALLNPDPWRPRKTAVRVLGTPYQCRAKDGDVGYVDGYVSGANGVPCAVFIAEDGYIELVPVHALVAPHFRELKGPGHA